MIDAYSDTWRGVAAKANEVIESCRSRLETSDQSYGESQWLRGRIAAMRELLDLVRPAVVVANPPEKLKQRDRSGV
jgi:hypothetical protein